MSHTVFHRLGLLAVAVMCAGLSAGPTADAAQSVAGQTTAAPSAAAAATAGLPRERLPFANVDEVRTEVVHHFADGVQCDGTGDAGGHFNVLHQSTDGPRYFKAWFLGDRFVVVRYRERPRGEPPTEKPAIAWMGEIAEDGHLRVEATVDGDVFADACSWLLGRDV